HGLSRDHRVEHALRAQPVYPRGEERERSEQDEGEEGEEEHPDGALGEGMDGADDSRTREKGSEEREAEGQENQAEIPELEYVPSFLDHHRVEERGGGEPGHEGRVLHRIPCPVAAPAQYVIAPPAADKETEGEEVPGDDGPAPGDGDPLLSRALDDQCRHREGEGHGEAREA